MHRFLIVGGLVLVLLAGFVRVLTRYRNLKSDTEFAREFLGQLHRFVDSEGKDQESYSWLIHRSSRMQASMGGFGVYPSYRPPFANYAYTNFQIIPNLLPEIRRSFQSIFLDRLAYEYANRVQESIVAYLGFSEDRLDDLERDLRNPLVWFREGVRSVLSVPIAVLKWSGLITSQVETRLVTSSFFKVLSGLITLVSVFAAVIGLVADWPTFWKAVRRWNIVVKMFGVR